MAMYQSRKARTCTLGRRKGGKEKVQKKITLDRWPENWLNFKTWMRLKEASQSKSNMRLTWADDLMLYSMISGSKLLATKPLKRDENRREEERRRKEEKKKHTKEDAKRKEEIKHFIIYCNKLNSTNLLFLTQIFLEKKNVVLKYRQHMQRCIPRTCDLSYV